MEIRIISVGKLKDKALQSLVENYRKMLSKYTKITLLEVKDEAEVKNATTKDIDSLLEKEAEQVKKQLKPGYTIALAIEGKMFGSEELANQIEHIKTYKNSTINFLIGGSYGLSESLKKEANMLISFSPLTFPHQLMRVILLEQLFRSMKILNNEPYHK